MGFYSVDVQHCGDSSLHGAWRFGRRCISRLNAGAVCADCVCDAREVYSHSDVDAQARRHTQTCRSKDDGDVVVGIVAAANDDDEIDSCASGYHDHGVTRRTCCRRSTFDR